jgi:hypothetical protein
MYFYNSPILQTRINDAINDPTTQAKEYDIGNITSAKDLWFPLLAMGSIRAFIC